MALDAGIFSQYMRRPRSVAEFDQMAMAEEDQQAKREANQLALMVQREGIAEQRRQREIDNQMMAALGQVPAQATPEDVAAVYRRFGKIDKAGAVLKDAATLAKEKALTGKAEAETEKARKAMATEGLKQVVSGLAGMNTPESGRAWMERASPVLSSVYGMQAAQQILGSIPTDPAQYEQWRQGRYASMVDDVKSLMTQYAARDLGGSVQTIGTNPVTGQTAMVGAPMAKTMTPGEIATDKRAAERLAYDRAQAAKADNAVTYQQGEDGTLVALPTRAKAGEVIRPTPVVAPGAGLMPFKGSKGAEKIDKAVEQFSTKLQKDGIPELETAIAGAEGALNRYQPGQVPGVGRVSGAVPSALLSGEGNDVRQAVAAVRNIVLNARSGAAVTDQELRRLVEELGTGLGQSEDALRRGLARVRERMEAIKANLAAGVTDDVLTEYQKRGGMSITRGGAKPSGQGGALSPSEQAELDALRQRFPKGGAR